MTGTYCSSCGAERAPTASFCANCGAPATAAAAQPVTAEQPVFPVPQTVAPQPVMPQPVAPQPVVPQPYAAQPPAPVQSPSVQPPPAYSAQPVPPAYPAQQPSYAADGAQYASPQSQHPYVPAAPWGTAPVAGPPRTGTARNVLDSLLTGDWGGAARVAGISVGAMLAVSLVGMLLLTQGGIGFHETLALVFAGTCLAVGGDAFAQADAQSFGASFSVGLLPLTVTLVGLGLLSWLFAKQVRSVGTTSTTEVLLHAVRTTLVFTLCFLPLSLLTRYRADGGNTLGLGGQLGVGVVSSMLGALLFAVLALGLTALLHRSSRLPGRFGAFREKALAPLFGAVAVFSIGLLAVLGALIWGLIEQGGKLAQLGAVVLAAGNGALASVLWGAGVPMNVDGSASATPLGQFAPSGTDVTLFTFTDTSAWFWLAPVLLLTGMLLVATALAVRQNTIEDARREGFRFAGALAFVGFVASLLLRIGFDGGGSASQFNGFQAAASGSMMFNPLMAAFVLALWGVLTGLLAPVVAAKVSPGFVTNVRRRFGAAPVAATAPQPQPPVY